MLIIVNLAISLKEDSCAYFSFIGLSVFLAIFLFAWVIVGASLFFMDESCKNGKTYVDSFNIWVICFAISAFWILVSGLTVFGALFYALFKNDQLKGRFTYSCAANMSFMFLYESMVKYN